MKPEDIERVKDLLPTSLGNDEIRREIAADILRRSVFSSRMAYAAYLAKVREVCTAMLEGRISQADARDRLETVLDQMGHSMQDAGGLRNPASIRRLNLILETQTQMAASVAQLAEQTDSVVELWPGWLLTRLEGRRAPREDWIARWNAAGESVDWVGARRGPVYSDGTSFAFAALKNSPIWQALGDGAGGFNDTLGNPYPPFAYSSGMGWEDLERETCEQYGLIRPGEAAEAPGARSLTPSDGELAEAADRYGFKDLLEGFENA